MAISTAILDKLEPISKLSPARKQELASLCFAEKVNVGLDPLRMNIAKSSQAIYLLQGELRLRYYNDEKHTISGGKETGKYSLTSNPKIKDTFALTDVVILRVDADLLDIMLTWDQMSDTGEVTKPAPNKPIEVSQVKQQAPERTTGDWMKDTAIFSALSLQKGVFSRLPVANVEEMFKRMQTIKVQAGQTLMQQGDEGDYYYLIQHGIAIVSRKNGPESIVVTELGEGGAFGEDALASDNKRNATVTMKTDGVLKRLNKKDFIELLKEPLITKVSMTDAKKQVAEGAMWIDVRLQTEYEDDHIEGAINMPLNEIRQLAHGLDKSKNYIVYCQTGRRSSAAVFALAQCGVTAVVLEK
jgi:rhodanese-related sulfurtransferase